VLADSIALAEEALRAVSGWARRAGARVDPAAQAAGEVAGFLDVRTRDAGTSTPDVDLVTVDQAPGVRLADLEDLAREALDVGDRQVRHWSPLVTGARRLRGPVRGGNSCEDVSETESVLDRVDAMLSIAAHAHLPTLNALLGAAADRLGHVLRDPVIVRSWLDRVPAGDVEARQALVVSLGLLGSPTPIEVA
jgi:hypothetical protein